MGSHGDGTRSRILSPNVRFMDLLHVAEAGHGWAIILITVCYPTCDLTTVSPLMVHEVPGSSQIGLW